MTAAGFCGSTAALLIIACAGCAQPSAKASTEPVQIVLGNGGALSINGKSTTLQRLAGDICTEVGGGEPACRQGRIFFRGDGQPTYTEFKAVMDVLQDNGLVGIAIVGEDAG